MKSTLVLLIVVSSVLPSAGQVGMGMTLNRQQRGNMTMFFRQQNTGAIVQSFYRDENSTDPSTWIVLLLDTNMQEALSITLDSLKRIKSYTVTKQDDLNAINQAVFDSSGHIKSYDVMYLDNKGDVVESIHLNKEAKINSRTSFYFNDKGWLDSTETYGPDARLTFRGSILLNEAGCIVKSTLKGMDGSLWNETDISYDHGIFPIELNSNIASMQKRNRTVFSYQPGGLVDEKREYNNMKLGSVRRYEYITVDSVPQFLEKNKIELGALKKDFEINFTYTYFLEHFPVFPGGYVKMMEYIDKNKKYPKHLPDRGVGFVIVAFQVKSNGSLTDITVQKPLLKDYDDLAVELIREMPKWIPARRTDGTVYEGSTAVKIEY